MLWYHPCCKHSIFNWKHIIGNIYFISYNGHTYQLDRLDNLKTRSFTSAFEKNTGITDGDVFAPMPGKIIEVAVKKGSKIKKDDKLIVLEAMKMENIITAQMDGEVSEIKINKNQFVNKNDLLIKLKPNNTTE